MVELQEQTKERLKISMNEELKWINEANIFQLVTDFTNAMIIAADVLDAREKFRQE